MTYKGLEDKLYEQVLIVKTLERELEAVVRTRDLYRDIIRKNGFEKYLPTSPDMAKLIAEIVTFWNSLFADRLAVGFRPTQAIAERVTERLQNFTKDDILAALQNRHDYVINNSWHNKAENMHHMINLLQPLKSDDSLLEAINYKAKTQVGVDMRRQTVKFKEETIDKTITE